MSAPCICAIFLIFGYSVFNHLCLQGAPATLTITRQPPKHRTIGYAQRPRYNRRSLARLDAANRPFPQSFQRLVIQPARVVFSHAATESEPINLVKGKYAVTYVTINKRRVDRR